MYVVVFGFPVQQNFLSIRKCAARMEIVNIKQAIFLLIDAFSKFNHFSFIVYC